MDLLCSERSPNTELKVHHPGLLSVGRTGCRGELAQMFSDVIYYRDYAEEKGKQKKNNLCTTANNFILHTLQRVNDS